MSRAFLNGRVTLHAGDCLAVLPTLPENSVDSVCTDPPYHLLSGNVSTDWSSFKTPKGTTNTSGRGHKTGFMGQKWDGGDIAFRPETWAAVLRVLKPGGHMVAFAAPKNAHRMICAIEDAGFEIRDTLMWLFGSGFPKSLDVSKVIDKAAGAERGIEAKALIAPFGSTTWCANCGKSRGSQPGNCRCNTNGIPATDAARAWEGWGSGLKPAYEPICLARKPLSEPTIAANVLRWGTGALNIGACKVPSDAAEPNARAHKQGKNSPGYEGGFRLADRAWNGSVGRWPANVLHDGSEEVVGAFPETADSKPGIRNNHNQGHDGWGSGTIRSGPLYSGHNDSGSAARFFKSCEWTDEEQAKRSQGRWPANVLHDGSEEVVAAFPETGLSSGGSGEASQNPHYDGSQVGSHLTGKRANMGGLGDSGSAARYFYTAKADQDDRLGSKHPTVKPLDLMQYLVRLVTPPRGVVLDIFAGTGTTGEAAWREGFSAILIEREPEYLADIERRMKLCLAGPDERARESIKARLKDKPRDAGPLFDGAAE